MGEIIAKCKQLANNDVILIDEEWAQEGVFWGFAGQVYQHHAAMVQRPRSKGLAGLVYSVREWPSRIPGQGTVLALQYGGLGIACHRSGEKLKEWQEVQQGLLTARDLTLKAQALQSKWQELEDQPQDLKRLLQDEIERGTFDHGRCDWCP
jgi:hypothetical protein